MRPVYRKTALDKLASPDELDRLMQITRPGSWLLLAGVSVVLGVVVLWGIFGSLTTTLDQSGTLTLSNPVVFIAAPDPGQLIELIVQSGDRVTPGQPVARLMTLNGEQDVLSAVNGQVLSIRASLGEPVDSESPLISVESFDRTDPQIEVVAYVSLADRQRIRAGMTVQVLPATVEREEYGYLEGRVRTVAAFAATREEMRISLGDSGFVEDLTVAGPVFEVRIALDTNEDGAYVWSASDGPNAQIVSGTPCSLIIQLQDERPISRVLNLP
ncbi:MAG: HlyD family efflux transporter periplasmic adaptor subunit [Anaerolineae bacterium]|nr:HlyD family efflux transporter periplasmic adaptor subunit [Anaerolineae bacterium]